MRNPPRSCDLHGGFFAPSGLPKPLPLGEVSPKVTERASPARKSRCAAMGRLFVRAMLSQRLGFAVSILALSVSSQAPRQLPQRGSHWHVGQLSSGRAKHNISEAAVLRCLGQRQLDKVRCPEAAVPASKARPFAPYRASGVQVKPARHARGSPSGGAVTPAASLRALREFVENARVKREEFVNVIKMRRRY